MQAKCELKYNGGQLVFSEPSTVGTGNVTKFNLTSNTNSLIVWDVSDPAAISELEVDENLSFTSATDSLKTYVHCRSTTDTCNKYGNLFLLHSQSMDGQAGMCTRDRTSCARPCTMVA